MFSLRTVRAELVEALHFSTKEEKPFDRLRANGVWLQSGHNHSSSPRKALQLQNR